MNGDETDGEAAAFWITNADNDFIENVVAGSQSNGYWLELLKRGTRASSFSSLEPKQVPLGRFEGNVAHSVPSFGLRFYLNGYAPRSLQTIVGLQVYR